MQLSTDPTRLPRPLRTPLLAAAVVGAILLTGCGGSSPSPTAATAGRKANATSGDANTGRTASSAATAASGGGAAGASSSEPGSGPPNALAFSKCMRSNGVSSFPDPKPGGGYAFPVNSSPTFKSAQAKCQKLLPNGGAPPAFSEQALMQLQRIAPCMRQHGVPDFPDPKRAPEGGPSLASSGYREIDYRGVLLELPFTINMQSPAYKQAAATCSAPFLVL
jgi:hypothetical protein